MATKIILKKSTTGGSAPLSGNIDVGELAINLADRKIYAKDGGGSIITLNGAYVDTVAPSNAVEGDLWYDTSNNLLKAHNGSGFVSAGYQTLSALEDTTITSVASGEILKWNGTAWVNNTLSEAGIAATSHNHAASDITSGTLANGRISSASVTQHEGDLTVTASQVSDFDTEVSNNSAVAANTAKVSNVTTDLSKSVTSTNVTIISSDGNNVAIGAATDSNAGLITGAEHSKLSGIESGADVTDTDNVTAAGALMDSELTDLVAVKAIDQGLTTTSNVEFNNLILAGNLTVNGTTTSVNSNQVDIGDSIITLNSDEAGTPSQNGGFEVERGTAANVSFVWNETDDAWDLSDETLQNVVLNGGSY